jgi:hypothetical protein
MAKKLNWIEKRILKKIIADMEKRHFRTDKDMGANEFAMQMHNYYRFRAGLPFLNKNDLPKWCEEHKAYDLCHWLGR